MTVTDVSTDTDTLAMTITTAFDAPIERVWQMWEDPRLLEQWWGPPTYPSTFTDHDLTPGGTMKYFMTGPEGDRHGGWWRMVDVDAPRSLAFEDGFADPEGNPNPAMPTTTITATLAARSDGGTTMTIVTAFPSLEAMEQLVAMGMPEGMSSAVGQIDDLLRVSA